MRDRRTFLITAVMTNVQSGMRTGANDPHPGLTSGKGTDVQLHTWLPFDSPPYKFCCFAFFLACF
jgi:hypothetical protein